MNCHCSDNYPEAPIDAGLKVESEVDSDNESIDLTSSRRDKNRFFTEQLNNTIKTKSYYKKFRSLNSSSRNVWENFITFEVLSAVIDNKRF